MVFLLGISSTKAQWGSGATSVGLTLGYAYVGRLNGAEAMLTWMDYGTGCVGYAGHALSGGVEVFPAANHHNTIWGEKLGGRIMFNGGYIGLFQQTFFLDEAIDHRLTPEIGFDAMTWANFGYGFSWHLAGGRITDLPSHRLIVRINLRKNYKVFDPRALYSYPPPIDNSTSE